MWRVPSHMSNNRDDQKKDPLRPSDPKRPHATLDLKAVEIKGPEQRAEAAKAAASNAPGNVPGASVKSDTKADPKADVKSDTKPEAKGSAGAAAAATSTSTAASGKGEAGKADASAHAAFKDKSQPPPREMPPLERTDGGGGFGRFVSHTLAGVVGGFLALLGADTLGPQLNQLGLPVGQSNSQATEQLGKRISVLEAASKTAPLAAEGAKLNAALDGLNKQTAQLEELKGRVAQLSEGQSQLKSEADALATKLASAPGAGATGSDPRIAKLEERLALLSAASANGKANAAVPELAAVTGKLADLESTMANQIDALRKSVGAEIDTRMGKASEAAEAARSGTQRIDRELAEVKTETTRLGQRMEALKADNERVSETLRVVQEETGKITSGVDALKGDVAAKFKAAAKPDDIAQAIAPMSAKMATLEKNIAGVVTAEENRKANAERIVLSLELANLKRVIDRGLGYAEELAQAKKAAGGRVDLSALEQYKANGVRTLVELQEDFRPLTHRIIAASEESADGGVIDRLLAGAKSVVRVRKVKHSADDDSVEAVVARMDSALEEGRISDFQTLAQKLSDKAKAPAADLFKQVAARAAVDTALKDIESQLKSSLGASAPSAPAPAIQ